jgi:hypothetical protein
MIVNPINVSNVNVFLAEKEVAVILFDARWDVGGHELIRPRYLRARLELGDIASFGEVDCDKEIELAKAAQVRSVPSIGYYRRGERIATTVGATQNVLEQTRRVIAGLSLGDEGEHRD